MYFCSVLGNFVLRPGFLLKGHLPLWRAKCHECIVNSRSTPRNSITPRKGYAGSYDGLPYWFNGEISAANATAPEAPFFLALEAARLSLILAFLASAFSSASLRASFSSFFWALVFFSGAGESALGLVAGAAVAGEADLGLLQVVCLCKTRQFESLLQLFVFQNMQTGG